MPNAQQYNGPMVLMVVVMMMMMAIHKFAILSLSLSHTVMKNTASGPSYNLSLVGNTYNTHIQNLNQFKIAQRVNITTLFPITARTLTAC